MGLIGNLVGAAVTAALAHTLYSYITSSTRDLPGPIVAKLTNLWRFLLVYKGRLHEIQKDLHDQHGDVVAIGPGCISISNPGLIKPMYANRSWIKSQFYSVSDIRIGNRIHRTSFSTRDEIEHSQIIRPVNKHLQTQQVLRHESNMDKTTIQFETKLNEFASSKQSCPVDRWLQFCAWDIMGETTFSTGFDFLRDSSNFADCITDSERAHDYFATVGQIPLIDRFLDKNPLGRVGPPSFAAGVAFCATQYARRISGKDGHDPIESYDFLDAYLLEKELNDDITGSTIVDWLIRNVLPGTETVAIELRAIVYFLCKNLQAQHKLQKELDAIHFTTWPPAYKETQRLPYLDAVINEALRLHPAISLSLERVVPGEGFTMPDGTYLSPGTIVGINPYVVGRHKPTYGQDADEFRPERWLQDIDEDDFVFNSRLTTMKDADFVFGFGKRSCPGRSLAIIEIFKIVAAMYSKFEIRLVDPQKKWKTKNSWLVRQWDMDVVVTRRGSDIDAD
ncbi:Isotrichodermin C-15 hydroxylase [Sphaceloma murrayae]|uniref:Isotrichodermin C-15 hydroxylase n=1 Tax=Sphaceloma murrayae TaxID=2082308 RepID=A0A2K1QW15_9PEZI|nr:Isotrichodermin C-15 hydroxylase [Sphaceloma murrayae]